MRDKAIEAYNTAPIDDMASAQENQRVAMDAAIAVVIEECAKVAEHLNGWGHQPCPELANHIAKAIRALAD